MLFTDMDWEAWRIGRGGAVARGHTLESRKRKHTAGRLRPSALQRRTSGAIHACRVIQTVAFIISSKSLKLMTPSLSRSASWIISAISSSLSFSPRFSITCAR
jgi:hypothetical protein